MGVKERKRERTRHLVKERDNKVFTFSVDLKRIIKKRSANLDYPNLTLPKLTLT